MTDDPVPLERDPSLPILRVGSLLALLGVAAGAFGAHGLRDRLSVAEMGWWETGVLYQLVHALALVAVGVVAPRVTAFAARAAAVGFAAGTVLFSGSLYAMALGGPRWLGAVTPVGGVLFLLGWLGLVLARPRRSAGA